MAFVVRRIARTHPSKLWEVTALVSKISEAYEANGRNKALIYNRGQGLPPGDVTEVIAEWTQDSLDLVVNVPDTVWENHLKLQELLESYPLEFYTLVTPEVLQKRAKLFSETQG